VDVVNVEALEWQAVPDTWKGKVAEGEPGVRSKMFTTGASAAPSGQLVEFEAGHHEAPHSHPERELFSIVSGDLTSGGSALDGGLDRAARRT
jgi:hypothetical protein